MGLIGGVYIVEGAKFRNLLVKEAKCESLNTLRGKNAVYPNKKRTKFYYVLLISI